MHENWKDFLVEHYKEVNQHLRDSDRNRNVLFGVYSASVGVLLTLGFSLPSTSVPDLLLLKRMILVFLSLFGVGVAFYTTVIRAWHCEYNRVAMAIQRAFLNGDLKLRRAAEEIAVEEKSKGHHYCRFAGAEFTVMGLVLLFIAAVLYLLAYGFISESELKWDWPAYLYLCAVVLILVFGVGIWGYRAYLHSREERFPGGSWCVDDRDDSTLEPKESRQSGLATVLAALAVLGIVIASLLRLGRASEEHTKSPRK